MRAPACIDEKRLCMKALRVVGVIAGDGRADSTGHQVWRAVERLDERNMAEVIAGNEGGSGGKQ